MTLALLLALSAIEVRVDPRVELMSTVFRLAGSPEYNHPASNSPYARAVRDHFGPFRKHPAIARAKELRRTRGVAFDAVVSLAVHCDASMQPAFAFDPHPARLDKRWRAEEAEAFLALVRDFAKQAKADAFFAAQKPFFDKAVARMRDVAQRNAHLDWFDAFFGAKPGAEYVVILGLLNGAQNYGIGVKDPKGKEILTPVLGMYRFDDDGVPSPAPRFVPLLIHELAHSYVNPIVDRHVDRLEAAALPVWRVRAPQMRKQAYTNWTIMMYESVVRACVLEHLRAHQGEAAVARQASDDYRMGFTWSADLATLLRKYQEDRVRYPQFDDFIPHVAAFFRVAAKKLPVAPRLVRMTPMPGRNDIDPATKEIVFEFDQTMRDKSWSVLLDGAAFPKITGAIRYDRARRRLTIPVRLQPATEYRFRLNSDQKFGFISEKGTPLAPLRIRFRTR
ncbi:MAG: DUF4932 domain-containing protein [Planctomycetota bacterium]